MYTDNVIYLNGLDGKKKKKRKNPRGLNPNSPLTPVIPFTPPLVPGAPNAPTVNWSGALPAGITPQNYSAPIDNKINYLKIGLYGIGALGVIMLLLKR